MAQYLTHWQFYVAVAVAAIVINFIWRLIVGRGKIA